MTRMLSGHPESLVLAPPPSFRAGPWLLAGSETSLYNQSAIIQGTTATPK